MRFVIISVAIVFVVLTVSGCLGGGFAEDSPEYAVQQYVENNISYKSRSPMTAPVDINFYDFKYEAISKTDNTATIDLYFTNEVYSYLSDVSVVIKYKQTFNLEKQRDSWEIIDVSSREQLEKSVR